MYNIHCICLHNFHPGACMMSTERPQEKTLDWMVLHLNEYPEEFVHEWKNLFVQLRDSAFLGLISRPLCTIEQVLHFEIKSWIGWFPLYLAEANIEEQFVCQSRLPVLLFGQTWLRRACSFDTILSHLMSEMIIATIRLTIITVPHESN